MTAITALLVAPPAMASDERITIEFAHPYGHLFDVIY